MKRDIYLFKVNPQVINPKPVKQFALPLEPANVVS